MVKRDIKNETESSLNQNLGEPERTPPDFPTFIAQIKNLAGTLTAFAHDGFRLADETEWRRRFGICKTCSAFVGNRCSKCGCYSGVKSRINAAECPLDKW